MLVQPNLITRHGTTTAYRKGCRCETCKEAQRAYNNSYHKKHRAKLNTKSLARRNEDPEKAREAWYAWFAANEDQARIGYRERAKAWYNDNRERALATSRQSYRNNRTARLAATRTWKRTNPEKVRAANLQYNARSRAAHGHVTAEQIIARVDFFGGVCAYCGGPYEHLDHAIPLSRGGTNWPANLRPACNNCNLRKHNKTVQEFLTILSQGG